MKPTAKLRFVERIVFVNKPAYNAHGGEGVASEAVKKTILQQWWEDARRINLGFGEVDIAEPTGEWRDVPLEKE